MIPAHLRPTRCIDGRLLRRDTQHDDPHLETDIGRCPECEGEGCSVCEICLCLFPAPSLEKTDAGLLVCEDCAGNE